MASDDPPDDTPAEAPGPKRGKVGRPTLLTPEAQARIVEATRTGAPRLEAARRAGISGALLFARLAEGREHPEGMWGELARLVQAADEEWREKRSAPGLKRRTRDEEAHRVAHLARVLDAGSVPEEEIAELVAGARGSADGLAALDDRAMEACRESLLAFAVHTYTGNKPFYHVNWHHRLLAEALERFSRGDARRLLISMPPRHGKTELAVKALGAWLLGRDPDARIVHGAYSSRLATKNSKSCRRIVGSPEYAQVFPDVRLPDRREILQGEYTMQAAEWELAGGARGGFYASGLSGSVTGMGGGFILIDDPCKNREQAESAIYQDTVLERYLDDWASRTEAPDCRLVMATRWGARDLIGQLLELAQSDDTADQWEVINIPAILQVEEERTAGDTRELGDPIWPELYLRPEEWDRPPARDKLVERARKDLLQRIGATIGGEALYQGRATVRSGGLVREDWLVHRWQTLPTLPGEWVQSWDPKASSSKRPWASYTVGQVWYRPTGQATCYLVDERRGKVGIDGALSMIRELSAAYPQATRKIVERKGYGGAMLDLLRSELTGLDDHVPKGDKVTRLEAVIPLLSGGNVILPDATVRPWVTDWVREVTRFSGKPTDVADRVDAMSQALDRWKSGPAQPFSYQTGGSRSSNGFRGR